MYLFFALQSKFDSWQLAYELDDTTNADDINYYGDLFINAFFSGFLTNVDNGGFISACSYHCGMWNTIHINDYNSSYAHYLWYNGLSTQSYFYQSNSYPCASCCS